MSRLSKTLRLWLPFLVIGAALVLLIEVGVQQSYRQGANDPQIQMAEDAAAALDSGASPQSLVQAQPFDISKSLAPFLIITDDRGTTLASSAKLNGANPLPPQGTLEAAQSYIGTDKGKEENRFTWQPQEGTRLATVVLYHGGKNPGYVIAGRNLREVESRESELTKMAALDFLGLLVGTFIILFVIA